MKKTVAVIAAAAFTLLLISCASKDAENYDDSYDYTLDEYDFINDIEPVATDDFLANIEPVDLEPLYFLKKSGKKVTPKEITRVALVPRTNAVEFHFRSGSNEIAVIWRKAERDKILEACQTFLKQYEEKTVPHAKVNKKNSYFSSKCSVWYGVLGPVNGCEKNNYYVIPEFIDKRPYLLIRFVPTQVTSGTSNQFTPKISLYMSPSQVRDFMEVMNQDNLEMVIKTHKEKAYTY